MSDQKRRASNGSACSTTGTPGPLSRKSSRRSSQAPSHPNSTARDPEKSAACASGKASISSQAPGSEAPAYSAGRSRRPSYSRDEPSPPPSYDQAMQAYRIEFPARARSPRAGSGTRRATRHVDRDSEKHRSGTQARNGGSNTSAPSVSTTRNRTTRPPLWRSGSSSSSCDSILGIGITEMVEDALDLVVDGHTSTQRYRRHRNPDPCSMM